MAALTGGTDARLPAAMVYTIIISLIAISLRGGHLLQRVRHFVAAGLTVSLSLLGRVHELIE